MDSTTQHLQATLDNEKGEGPLKPIETQDVATSQLYHEDNVLTRYGLNLTSFKKGHYGKGTLELKRPMEARHLNMIAIGGAIGAGFFVGSGKALSSGVSIVQLRVHVLFLD
jgi:amino acid transporter